MRITTVLATAATIATLSTTAFAGGLAPEVVETPAPEVAAAPAGSSVNPAFIVLGILAALLIVAANSDGGSGLSMDLEPV